MKFMSEQLHRLWRGITLTLAAAVLLGGCSAPLVPEARVSRAERVHEPDAALLSQLRADWKALQVPGIAPQEYRRLVARYNDALLRLLRRYRADMRRAFERGERDYELPGIVFELEGGETHLPLREVYEDIVPAADIVTRDLQKHYTVPGLGVPMVGIVPAENVSKIGRRFNIRTRGTVSTLTAVMTFPTRKGAKPVLRMVARDQHETLALRGYRHQLAGDFSAAIEIYWNLTRVKEGRLLGLLRPQQLRDVNGLSCMEAYNPDKIPVILAHGLMSSAGTFDNLVNRLMSDPNIRLNYQFWYYNYPTGVSWTLTAARYREELMAARRQLDPHKRNRNWDNMVVVGHSMGGLITHYSQCTEPWHMLREYPLDSKGMMGSSALLRSAFFFRPVKAGMVVYMATPHRGAPLARYRIVMALTKLVQLPQNIVSEVVNIATLQQDSVLLNPGKLTEAFTSLSQLSPDSYSIRGLQGLQVRNVPTHSIIGDEGDGDTPRSSDGVVPYWSSHISWGGESIVPADHSVQDVPESAEILRNLLMEHLKRIGRSRR